MQAAMFFELLGGLEIGASARDVCGEDNLTSVHGLANHVGALLVPVDSWLFAFGIGEFNIRINILVQVLQLPNRPTNHQHRPLTLNNVENLQYNQLQPAVITHHDIFPHDNSFGFVGWQRPELHIVDFRQDLLFGVGAQRSSHPEYAVLVELDVAHVGDERCGQGLGGELEVVLELDELVEAVAPHCVV